MKQKIKEALQQKYKNLGLNEEAFDGVAAFGETIGITEETLANFVEGAKGLLTKAQSDADKARTAKAESQKQIDELTAKLAEAEAKLKNKSDDDDQSKKTPEDIAALIQSAVTAAVKPLQDKLKAFEDEGTAKQALRTAKDALFGNDYAKKYTQERDDAWERAVEIYEATGKKMTAEELQSKAMDYFNKSVARKGVDTSKPFEAEGKDDKDPDFSAQKKFLQSQGLIPKDE